MPPAPAFASARVTVLVWLLFAIQLVSMGAMEMSGPFWPVHLQGLTDSPTVFTFASIAVYVGPMLGILLTSAFWGRIGDRYGHKPMMIRALAGLALTQLGLALSEDIWMILLLRFVQGACAGYIAPAQAYGVSIEAPARRARLFALLQISTNVGSLLGAVLGGLILDHATFFWINVGASLLCALCMLVAVICLPNVPPARAGGATGSKAQATDSLWRDAPLRGLLLVMGILLLARMLPQTSFSLYVSTMFDVSHSLVGLCYGLLALGFIVSATAWSRHFERRSRTDTLRRIAWVVLGCMILTGIAGITRQAPLFVASYFLWGVLLGATTPVLMALLSKSVDATRQGHVLGLAQGSAQFASIAGICFGGLLNQLYGLQYTYLFVCLAYAVALLVMLVMLVQRRRPVD